jgi:hypothetical protein
MGLLEGGLLPTDAGGIGKLVWWTVTQPGNRMSARHANAKQGATKTTLVGGTTGHTLQLVHGPSSAKSQMLHPCDASTCPSAAY